MPPKIERKQLADITVSAGEMLKFEGNVIGEPPADVTWEKEGDIVDSKSDKSLTITNVPYNTKLIIRSCKRNEGGTYTVLAKNSVGSDQVIVKLTVLDKPSPPENLKASDIHATGCTLKWRRLGDTCARMEASWRWMCEWKRLGGGCGDGARMGSRRPLGVVTSRVLSVASSG